MRFHLRNWYAQALERTSNTTAWLEPQPITSQYFGQSTSPGDGHSIWSCELSCQFLERGRVHFPLTAPYQAAAAKAVTALNGAALQALP